MPTLSEDYPAQLERARLENQVSDLRNQIGDLGTEIDTFKAKKGGAIGGGVFLLLLALIAGYDLFKGKANLWLSVGISGESLKFIAIGFAAASLISFSVAVILEKTRDHSREAKLAELEHELESLLIRKSALE